MATHLASLTLPRLLSRAKTRWMGRDLGRERRVRRVNEPRRLPKACPLRILVRIQVTAEGSEDRCLGSMHEERSGMIVRDPDEKPGVTKAWHPSQHGLTVSPGVQARSRRGAEREEICTLGSTSGYRNRGQRGD